MRLVILSVARDHPVCVCVLFSIEDRKRSGDASVIEESEGEGAAAFICWFMGIFFDSFLVCRMVVTGIAPREKELVISQFILRR